MFQKKKSNKSSPLRPEFSAFPIPSNHREPTTVNTQLPQQPPSGQTWRHSVGFSQNQGGGEVPRLFSPLLSEKKLKGQIKGNPPSEKEIRGSLSADRTVPKLFKSLVPWVYRKDHSLKLDLLSLPSGLQTNDVAKDQRILSGSWSWEFVPFSSKVSCPPNLPLSPLLFWPEWVSRRVSPESTEFMTQTFEALSSPLRTSHYLI